MKHSRNSPLSPEAEAFEKAAIKAAEARYVLRLYVSGTTARSVKAISNLKRICEQHLKNRYELEVIDIYQHPELASSVQLIAAPTLIRQLPRPIRKIVGDLSDSQRVLIGLDLQKHPS